MLKDLIFSGFPDHGHLRIDNPTLKAFIKQYTLALGHIFREDADIDLEIVLQKDGLLKINAKKSGSNILHLPKARF